jgi:TRAP transporter 4TM/12TM fusion protein
MGWPLPVIAIIFMAYALWGPIFPGLLQHSGASWPNLVNHLYLTSQGIYGIAVGVVATYVFHFVLFGVLATRIGLGQLFIDIASSIAGRYAGGPAKVSVFASALFGMLSGSSVANAVTVGSLTIPAMIRLGYPRHFAGAVEAASSTGGQIMPPVMGAAAFLMVEYVGIPYTEIVKHAFLPAVISYIALFYIVHLEALKLGMEPMAKAREKTLGQRAIGWGLGVSGTIVVCALIYWIAEGVKPLFGDAAPWLLGLLLAALYVYSVYVASKCPDLPADINVDNPVLPETWPTVKAGLHFLIPIGVLIWALMIDELSPSLSAFWATVSLMVLMVTQRVLTAVFRKQRHVGEFKRGVNEVIDGLNDGARNMIGIAIATGTAGIIVGGITLTGLGLRMTDFVEVVSQGNVIAMLLFTAFVCLVLGLGVPTTANYILVATLMAPVIVELGAQSGLIIPLIAVHLFVFYFGIMGDITPPVGLATFAAAAISGEDPIKTGIQGSIYALRTVVLPFVFIFNPALLIIDVHGWWEIALVAFAATVASCVFAAATMNWFQTKCRWWEVVLLLVATFALFRPDFFMNYIAEPYKDAPAKDVYAVAKALGEDDRIVMVIEGTNVEGDDVKKTVAVQLTKPGEGRDRLTEAGLTMTVLGDNVQVTNVKFGSRAKKSGFEPGWKVSSLKVPTERVSEHWVYIPALTLVALIYFLQRARMRRTGLAAA